MLVISKCLPTFSWKSSSWDRGLNSSSLLCVGCDCVTVVEALPETADLHVCGRHSHFHQPFPETQHLLREGELIESTLKPPYIPPFLPHPFSHTPHSLYLATPSCTAMPLSPHPSPFILPHKGLVWVTQQKKMGGGCG